MGKKIDLTGQTFDRLKVIGEAKRSELNHDSGTYWRCRCQCGNEVIVSGKNLRSKNTRSCGCLVRDHAREISAGIRDDMSGTSKDGLKIIERVDRPEGTPYGKYMTSCWYRCRCICGKEAVLASQYIRNVPSPSCGCRKRQVNPASRKIGNDGSYVKLERVDGTLQAKGVDGALVGLIRNDRDCAQCGKTFDMYAGNKWAWRKQFGGKILVFCSYGCIRKHDEAHPQKFTTVKY